MSIPVTPTPLSGVVLIDPKCFEDERGFFFESWNQKAYAEAGLPSTFVQDSHSRSHRGVLRGLHYQDMTVPLAKLVRCTAGAIFDVAVDLRVGSPTFGQWFGAELSAANKRQMFIPIGCAHGFVVTSDVAEVQYEQTDLYTPSAERSLAWNDPDVGVAWPIADPQLSNRDRRGHTLADYLKNPTFEYGPVKPCMPVTPIPALTPPT